MRDKIRRMLNNPDQLISDLQSYITRINDENSTLRQQLKDFRQEDEIKKLEDHILHLRSHSISVMTENEKYEAEEFSNQHYKSCKGNTRYIVEGTGIGDAIKVQCTKCNEVKDITDTSNW
jgi:predicted RNase H-like nuclease (RuvC/YqgF family)